jgi:hypothetical protein
LRNSSRLQKTLIEAMLLSWVCQAGEGFIAGVVCKFFRVLESPD